MIYFNLIYKDKRETNNTWNSTTKNLKKKLKKN